MSEITTINDVLGQLKLDMPDLPLSFKAYEIPVGHISYDNNSPIISLNIIYDDRIENIEDYFIPTSENYNLFGFYFELQKYMMGLISQQLEYINPSMYSYLTEHLPLNIGVLFLDGKLILDDTMDSIYRSIRAIMTKNIILEKVVIFNAEAIENKENDSTDGLVLNYYTNNILLIKSCEYYGIHNLLEYLKSVINCQITKLFNSFICDRTPYIRDIHGCNNSVIRPKEKCGCGCK